MVRFHDGARRLRTWRSAAETTVPSMRRKGTPRVDSALPMMSSMTRDWLNSSVRWPSATRRASSFRMNSVLQDAAAPADSAALFACQSCQRCIKNASLR